MEITKYEPGQKVELVIIRETNLGFLAKINGEDTGLLYHNEIFEHLEPHQELPGYIKKIREDGGIDLQLKAFGNFGVDELAEQILEALNENEGYIPVNAKSPAETIHDHFGVSKKNFKMALGSLYKKRQVTFTDEGTQIVKK
jgi:uncharacterized protein